MNKVNLLWNCYVFGFASNLFFLLPHKKTSDSCMKFSNLDKLEVCLRVKLFMKKMCVLFFV